MKSYYVLGVKIDYIELNELKNKVIKDLRNNINNFITFRDVASLMAVKNNTNLLKIQNTQVTISCADGWPIAYIGKTIFNKFKRVTGPDFFKNFIEEKNNYKHFFIGSTYENLNKLSKNINKITNTKIVGAISPIFDKTTNQQIIKIANKINSTKAQLVWVGISSPKQEILISKLRPLTNATFFAVGAALEFYTGKQKRAPKIFRYLLMEWFFRLITAPKRLGYRYLVLAPKFVILIFLEKFFKKN